MVKNSDVFCHVFIILWCQFYNMFPFISIATEQSVTCPSDTKNYGRNAELTNAVKYEMSRSSCKSFLSLFCGMNVYNRNKGVASHYGGVIMGAIASQITSLTIVYSTVYSDADQRKHQGSASLAFVWGIHRGPVNSPHKWPVSRKMFPFVDVIMNAFINGIWSTLYQVFSIY